MIETTESVTDLAVDPEDKGPALYVGPSFQTALRCALADLECIMPKFDPEHEHPAWETIEELRVLVESEHLPAADWYDPFTQIVLVWSIEDVMEVRPDLTDEQAMHVLRMVEKHHDAMIGVSWDTLTIWASDLFGEAPKRKDSRK